MPGRPPSADPVRRNARIGPVTLPAEGRAGLAPNWPLDGGAANAEAKLWAELWATPQAVMWETLGWTRIVARYVRCCLAAELLDRHAMAEARQLEDRLGLTPKAMRLLMWSISADEVAEKRQDTSAGARGRIKAVG